MKIEQVNLPSGTTFVIQDDYDGTTVLTPEQALDVLAFLDQRKADLVRLVNGPDQRSKMYSVHYELNTGQTGTLHVLDVSPERVIEHAVNLLGQEYEESLVRVCEVVGLHERP
jgi:hypothetical protein